MRTFLACGDDDVQTPIVEPDLLASDGTDGVQDDQGLRRDLLDDLCDALRVGQDTLSRDELILLLENAYGVPVLVST